MGFPSEGSDDAADSENDFWENTSPMSGIFILETPVVSFEASGVYSLTKEYRNAILSLEQVNGLSHKPEIAILQARLLWNTANPWQTLPQAHMAARRAIKNVTINIIRIDREF